MLSDNHLDLLGLKCPLPLLRTKATLKRLPEGATLSVSANDPEAERDFREYCALAGYQLTVEQPTSGTFVFRIKRGTP